MIILDGMQADVSGRRDGHLLPDGRATKTTPMPRHARRRRRRHHPRHVQVRRRSRGDRAAPRCTSSAAARSCATCSRRRRCSPRSMAVASNVWSVTSYTQLRRDAHACERWNMLHPDQPPQKSLRRAGARPAVEGLFVAASRLRPRICRSRSPAGFPATVTPSAPTAWAAAKPAKPLRRHFEVDAESAVVATLLPAVRVSSGRRNFRRRCQTGNPGPGIEPDRDRPAIEVESALPVRVSGYELLGQSADSRPATRRARNP